MGAAFSHGFDVGGDIAAKQQAHKQALSDTELEANIGDANENIKGFRAKLSQYAPGSPESEQAKQGLQQALQARTQLFHPANNPSAMSKFGHMLLDHMPGKQASAPPVQAGPPTVSATPAMQLPSQIPPTNGTGANSFTLPAGPGPTLPQGSPVSVQGPQTPQQLKTQAQANLIASAAPTPPPGAAEGLLTPEEQRHAARIHAGLEAKAAPDRPDVPVNKNALVPGTDASGSPVMGYVEDGKFVPVTGTTVPLPKAGPQSNSALSVTLRSLFPDVTDGRYTEEQLREAMTKPQQWKSPDTTSTHQSLVFDQNNQGHVFTGTSTSHKSFGSSRGGGGSSAPASAPSGKQAKSSGGSKSRSPIGPAIEGFGKRTPEESKTSVEFASANRLKSLADDAWSKPSAVKDKQLALQIIRGAAGRVNMQEYDILTKRAGIANSLEAWVNKATTGELPTDIRKQLVDAVHSNYDAAAQAKEDAFQAVTPTPGDLKGKAKSNTSAGKSLADRLNDALGGK